MTQHIKVTLSGNEEKLIANPVVNDKTVTVKVDSIYGAYMEYTGSYEVTPSAETQVLPVENKAMMNDLVVNPIPSNYGLITWNGSVLTVS